MLSLIKMEVAFTGLSLNSNMRKKYLDSMDKGRKIPK
jgi:hypothetical protein